MPLTGLVISADLKEQVTVSVHVCKRFHTHNVCKTVNVPVCVVYVTPSRGHPYVFSPKLYLNMGNKH